MLLLFLWLKNLYIPYVLSLSFNIYYYWANIVSSNSKTGQSLVCSTYSNKSKTQFFKLNPFSIPILYSSYAENVFRELCICLFILLLLLSLISKSFLLIPFLERESYHSLPCCFFEMWIKNGEFWTLEHSPH